MRQKKKDPNKLSSISTKKQKREPESEKVLRENQKKGERHGTDLTIK